METGTNTDGDAKIKTADIAMGSFQAEESADLGNVVTEETSKKEDPIPLPEFDMLRFKDHFFEAIEELRFRRTQDCESTRRIEELLSEKHKLIQKLDEMEKKCELLSEEHKTRELECMKKHEEELRQHRNDQIKSGLLKESREKELKSLKDEMRALHLTNHNLEKRVQELERQLQHQNSSKDNHLSKMAQLEEKCSILLSVAEQVKEQIERLEVNVKQAEELQLRLNYVNSHQKCEMGQLQEKLKCCNHELVQLRAQLHDKKCSNMENGSDPESKLKSVEQELKMQSDLFKHLQDELTSLRLEHQKVLHQLKEAHSLLEKHVQLRKTSADKEEKLKGEVESLKTEIERLKGDLLKIQEDYESQRANHEKVAKELEEELCDTKLRLRNLQADFKGLQDSYDSLESSKNSLLVQHVEQVQKLGSHKEQLEIEMAELAAENRELQERCHLSFEQVKSFQAALDQSEAELKELKVRVQEKDRQISQLERRKLEVPMSQVASPEVISEAALDQSEAELKELKVRVQEKDRQISQLERRKLEVPMSQVASPEVISDNDNLATKKSETLLKTPLGVGCTNVRDHLQSETMDCEENRSDPCTEGFPSCKRQKVNALLEGAPENGLEPVPQANHMVCEEHLIGNGNGVKLSHLVSVGLLNENTGKDGVIEIEDSPPLSVSELSMTINEYTQEQRTDSMEKQSCKGTNVAEYDKINEEHSNETANNLCGEIHGEGLKSPVTGQRGGSSGLEFSPDEKSEMISTQINKQIQKVEKFLKSDRLRRKRDMLINFHLD